MCLTISHWTSGHDEGAIEPVYKMLCEPGTYDGETYGSPSAWTTPFFNRRVPRHGFLTATATDPEFAVWRWDAANGDYSSYDPVGLSEPSPGWLYALNGEAVHSYYRNGWYSLPMGCGVLAAYALGVIAWDANRGEVGSFALYVPELDFTTAATARRSFFRNLLRSRLAGRLQRLLDFPQLPRDVRSVVAQHGQYEW